MSAIWRAAVDWHATTLNPVHSLILSLLADSANEAGEAKPDLKALAWQGRTDARTVRKTLEGFVEAGILDKIRPGVFRIDRYLLDCHGSCGCPRSPEVTSKDAPGTTQSPPDAQRAALKPEKRPARQDLSEAGVMDGTDTLAAALEVIWRGAFKTEPAPGLLRKTARDLQGPPVETVSAAFEEYLRRVKDPMYLNLAKFASTWRAYLEPAKGSRKTEDAFSRVFSPFERAVLVESAQARIANIGDSDL